MSPADGLVTGQEDVTVFPAHHILFAGVEIMCLTCDKREISDKMIKNGGKNDPGIIKHTFFKNILPALSLAILVNKKYSTVSQLKVNNLAVSPQSYVKNIIYIYIIYIKYNICHMRNYATFHCRLLPS